MVFWDAEFDGWRTTECGFFHCMYHTREEAEKKEQEIKQKKERGEYLYGD